jgi:hypothetical protein
MNKRPEARTLSALGDLDQVIPELGLDRAMHLADLVIKNHAVEFRNHLPLRKLTKVPAAAPRRTLGVFAGRIREIRAPFDLGLQFQAFFFRWD